VEVNIQGSGPSHDQELLPGAKTLRFCVDPKAGHVVYNDTPASGENATLADHLHVNNKDPYSFYYELQGTR
jgi:hypothetical protein